MAEPEAGSESEQDAEGHHDERERPQAPGRPDPTEPAGTGAHHDEQRRLHRYEPHALGIAHAAHATARSTPRGGVAARSSISDW